MAFVKQKFDQLIQDNLDKPWDLSYLCELTEDFIENNLDKIDWYAVLVRQVLSENFLKKHFNKIKLYQYKHNYNNPNFGIETLIAHQKISEKFIDEIFTQFPEIKNNNAKYYWRCISNKHKLSEDFIRKYKANLSWKAICRRQKISENFMNEHLNYLDFKTLSRHQKLSPEFISLHFNKLDLEMLLRNKKLSLESKNVLLNNSKKVVESLLAKNGRRGR